MNFRLDKSVFRTRKQGEDPDPFLEDACTMSYGERFRAGWYLSCRAYGLDPFVHHRIDGSVFMTRKHPD